MNLAESKLVTVVKRIVKPLLLVAALSVVGRTPLVKAQQPAPTKAQADAIGLCVVFRQIAADPSLVNAAGLSVEDGKATAEIVRQFVHKLDALGKDYDSHRLSTADIYLLRDMLLEQTRTTLKKRLTSQGWRHLTAFIRVRVKQLHIKPVSKPNGDELAV